MKIADTRNTQPKNDMHYGKEKVAVIQKILVIL